MGLGYFLTKLFEKFPELTLKNNIREFLAFNKFVPKFVSALSPLKGYSMYYQIKEGDIVIDAGAFTGDYTIFAAKKVGKEGKIIAFEPELKNRRILVRNLKHKKLNNVLVIPKGLWSKNTSLKISNLGLHSSISETKGEKIDVVKLDSELKNLKINKVDFIKMDIEGAEIEALKGAINTLKKNNLRLAVASYHLVNGKITADFIEKYLLSLGYYVKSDFPKHLTTYAWKSIS